MSRGAVATDNGCVRNRVLSREPPRLHARVLHHTLVDVERVLEGDAAALCTTHLQDKVRLDLGMEPFKFIQGCKKGS